MDKVIKLFFQDIKKSSTKKNNLIPIMHHIFSASKRAFSSYLHLHNSGGGNRVNPPPEATFLTNILKQESKYSNCSGEK